MYNRGGYVRPYGEICAMTKIILDPQQANVLKSSNGDVTIVDESGQVLGYVQRSSFTPEEIAEAKLRSQAGGPWRTTEQVMGRLRSLGADICDTP
jgi:hypothetical protein